MGKRVRRSKRKRARVVTDGEDLVDFDTRPEAIKLCPLDLALRNHAKLTPHVCMTGPLFEVDNTP